MFVYNLQSIDILFSEIRRLLQRTNIKILKMTQCQDYCSYFLISDANKTTPFLMKQFAYSAIRSKKVQFLEVTVFEFFSHGVAAKEPEE